MAREDQTRTPSDISGSSSGVVGKSHLTSSGTSTWSNRPKFENRLKPASSAGTENVPLTFITSIEGVIRLILQNKIIARSDYIVKNQANRVILVVEMKDGGTIGLVLDQNVKVPFVQQQGFGHLAWQALRQLQHTGNVDVYGAVEQLLFDMIIRGVSWGILSDFSNAVILHLRDSGSEGGTGPGLTLHCYVYDVENHCGVNFARCFLYAIRQAKESAAAILGEEKAVKWVLNREQTEKQVTEEEHRYVLHSCPNTYPQSPACSLSHVHSIKCSSVSVLEAYCFLKFCRFPPFIVPDETDRYCHSLAVNTILWEACSLLF